MISPSHSLRAFTLIETAIVVALATGVMTALAFMILSFNATSSYEQASALSSGSASAVMREIAALASPADAVVAAHTFSSATYTSTSTTLVLEIPSIDSSGNTITNAYDYAAFFTTGAKVYRLLEANVLSSRRTGTKQLSSTANALTFTYDAADFTKVSMVTVDIQTQVVVKQHVFSDHRNGRIRLRNH